MLRAEIRQYIQHVGEILGLLAQINEHSPNAEYIPFSSCNLNLVGNSAVQSSLTAISYFDFIQNTYIYFLR
jgi:hypothetical protein